MTPHVVVVAVAAVVVVVAEADAAFVADLAVTFSFLLICQVMLVLEMF